jgi:predicted metal-dependent peptidase
MDQEAANFLEVAISKLVAFKPLYGTIFLYLKKVQVDNVPTMGVGPYRRTGLALFYNPDFVNSLTEKQIRSVLQHEALHVLLHHIFRAQHYGYNHVVYNIAADLAINCNIEGLPEWVYFPEKLGFEDYQSADWYYDKIKEQAKANGKSLDDLISDMDGDLLDDHSSWEEGEDGEGVDAEVLKEKIKGINEKAIKAQQERNWGSIPGGLAEAILAANRPTVDWRRELRYFINKLVQRGRKATRSRPNRRYGYSQPGSKRNYTSRILVALDTSGSVSNQDLSDFVAEINGMFTLVQCDVICFDTQVYGDPKAYTKKRSSIDVEGRGGTSFGPVLDLAEESGYEGVILFTDGFAPFPPKPIHTRVMWALTKSGEGVEPPYGKKVVIDKMRNQ